MPEIWQEIEGQAFHAYREWPLWLVLRIRELQVHQSETNPPAIPHPDNPSSLPNSNSTVVRRPSS